MSTPDTIIGKNNSKQKIKVLFARLGEHLQQQTRENNIMARSSSTKSTTGEELKEAEDSASLLKNTTTSCAQSSYTDKKTSMPTVLDDEVQSSPPISLPFITFDDGCDEAEKLARAKRVEVIMKLSAEAKAKANIRPLTWARPTFNYPSSTSNSSTASGASQAATLGKRKNRQEGFDGVTSDSFCFPRQPTEEEVQALVDFADTWFPKSKRRNTESGGDDEW